MYVQDCDLIGKKLGFHCGRENNGEEWRKVCDSHSTTGGSCLELVCGESDGSGGDTSDAVEVGMALLSDSQHMSLCRGLCKAPSGVGV